MFEDTSQGGIDAQGGADPLAPFRVGQSQERLRLLRELRDGGVPVHLSGPGGAALDACVWTVDSAQDRLSLNVEADEPQLASVAAAGEAVAVAFLASVKLQFELRSLVLVRSNQAVALQCALPLQIYRFQRRNAFRVRTIDRQVPTARFRHPELPGLALALRVIDASIGGCALWLPHDVLPLQPGTQIGDMQLELDADTRFLANVTLQHVSASSRDAGNAAADSARQGSGGVRLGCAWRPLTGNAERMLQRWIDRTQQRRRLLAMG